MKKSYDILFLEGQKDPRKGIKNEKTSFPPCQRQEVAPGDHVRFRSQEQNAERRNAVVILFQVRDLAAKACGEPHIAPTWEIAKASLGAMLAKTPELAERAASIRVDNICEWDPANGLIGVRETYLDSESGDVCLAEFRAACAKEEYEKQEEAENDG